MLKDWGLAGGVTQIATACLAVLLACNNQHLALPPPAVTGG